MSANDISPEARRIISQLAHEVAFQSGSDELTPAHILYATLCYYPRESREICKSLGVSYDAIKDSVAGAIGELNPGATEGLRPTITTTALLGICP